MARPPSAWSVLFVGDRTVAELYAPDPVTGWPAPAETIRTESTIACWRCGRALPRGARFCGYCGTRLE